MTSDPTIAALPESPSAKGTSARPRDARLDVLRVAACAAVIALHVSARMIYAYDQVDALSWTLANLVNSAVRWCVPVFVMISGALLLSRPIERPREFLFRRARILVPAIIVWNAVYLAWRILYHQEALDLSGAARSFLTGDMYYHLYFLFLIAGLYVFAPALSYALQRLPDGIANATAAGAVAIACAAFALGNPESNIFTYFAPYLGYFILGALIARRPRISPVLSALVFIATVLLTASVVAVTVRKIGPMQPWSLYFHQYFSPTVIPMAIAVFALFAGLPIPARMAKLAAWLAPATLGIYLIHPIVLELVRARVGDANLLFPWPYLDAPVVFVLVAVCSTTIVLILRRVPLLRGVI